MTLQTGDANRMPNSFKHSDPHFKRIRNAMNRESYANPATRCRRCGLTRDQHPAGDKWTCGHPDAPGDIGYAPEMKSCNCRLSAQQTHAKKKLGNALGL